MEIMSLSEVELKFQIQLTYFNTKFKLDVLSKMAVQKDFLHIQWLKSNTFIYLFTFSRQGSLVR